LSPEFQALNGELLDGRFAIGEILARGGFATVVDSRDVQEGGRRCAIKIFRQEWADQEWMQKRFRQEVQALEQIEHPNVVRIYGHGTTPKGALYLVMEFIKGTTLRELLGESRLDPLTVASYMRQMGSALAEIHSHGICHRDLKPENLMVRDAAPLGQEIVVIDFSIAIVKDPDETLHGLSRAAGTFRYMAPEQGVGYADASTDIYSLAKVLIEMLAGKPVESLLPDASIDLPQRVRELLERSSFGLSKRSVSQIARALEFHPLSRATDALAFATAIADDLERDATQAHASVE
jgi:serine/threonine-protein kinase